MLPSGNLIHHPSHPHHYLHLPYFFLNCILTPVLIRNVTLVTISIINWLAHFDCLILYCVTKGC